MRGISSCGPALRDVLDARMVRLHLRRMRVRFGAAAARRRRAAVAHHLRAATRSRAGGPTRTTGARLTGERAAAYEVDLRSATGAPLVNLNMCTCINEEYLNTLWTYVDSYV